MKISRYLALLGSAVLAAMSASLCCILPMIAMLLGASGLVTGLGWIAVLRPYLAAFSLITLTVAWYRKWQHRAHQHHKHDCKHGQAKTSFWQSKKFLAIATIFSVTSLVFPYVDGYILGSYANQQPKPANTDAYSEAVIFVVPDIHCKRCQRILQQAIDQLEGVGAIKFNQQNKTIQIEFDPQKVSIEQIEAAIASTGYTIQSVQHAK